MSDSMQKFRQHHRHMVRSVDRKRAEIDRLTEEADTLVTELEAARARAADRLGVEVPADGLLLDVLDLIEVEPDGAWSWSGGWNNKGLAVVRYRDGSRMHDRSVVRLLAESFGIIDPDWEGILYPLGSTSDVNPWHREPRGFPDGRTRGNANRYWRTEQSA